MNIRVVLASPDQSYSERLLHYVRSSEEGLEWHFHSFTDAALCNRYLSSEASIDLLVVDELWKEKVHSDLPQTVWLTENEQFAERNVVHKYQPIPQLLAQLKSFGNVAQNQLTNAVPKKREQTSVIAVYSASGGTGKTTTALHLLKLAKEQRLRTFYFNLEMVQAALSMGHASEEDCFARLLYYVKSGQLDDEFEQTKRHDERLGCDYIPAFHHFINRLEFGSSEFTTVLERIVKTGDYDLIIVDLDSFLHESTVSAIQQCDSLLWLVTDDVQCVEKTNMMIRALAAQTDEADDVMKKTLFILNKHTGTIANDMSSLTIAYELPYIPQWKSVTSIQNLDHAPIFTKQLRRLFDACTPDAADRVIGSGTP